MMMMMMMITIIDDNEANDDDDYYYDDDDDDDDDNDDDNETNDDDDDAVHWIFLVVGAARFGTAKDGIDAATKRIQNHFEATGRHPAEDVVRSRYWDWNAVGPAVLEYVGWFSFIFHLPVP